MSSRFSLRRWLQAAADWRSLARTPYGLRPALIVTAVTLFVGFEGELLTVAGPNIAQDLSLDLNTVIGVIATVTVLGLIASLGVGWLADRVRRLPILAIGLVLQGVGALVGARATDLGSLATPRSVATVGGRLTGIPAGSLIADYYPVEARGRVFSMIGTLGNVATLGSLLAVGWFVTNVGWRKTAGMLGIPILVMALAVLTLKEPVRGYFERRAMGFDEATARIAEPPQSFGEAWRATWSSRTLRRLFVADIASNLGAIPFTQMLGFYLADQFGLDAFHRGLVLTPTVAAALVGGFLGGGLIDAFSSRTPSGVLRLTAVFAVIASLGVFGVALAPSVGLLVLCFIFVSFGFALIGPTLGAVYSQVIPPTVRTQGLQVSNLALLFGFLSIFPAELIQSNFGFQAVFLTCCPLLVISGLIQLTAADFFETDRRNQLISAVAAAEARSLRAAGQAKLLSCRSVNVYYGGNQVLFGVDLDVEEGEILALLGTNGAGKSTLLRAISGVSAAADGAIFLDGREITHMPPHEIAARGVAHMPGGRGVFPGLTVEENLKLGTWLSPGADVDALLKEAYGRFPALALRARGAAGLLSGGEQQMVSLARAFMAKPRLLLIDELTLGLAPAAVAGLLEMVKAIRDRGTTVIVVEQSVNLALTIAERAVFMEKGEVRFTGPTADLLRRPDILRAVYVKGTAGLRPDDSGIAAAARHRRQQALEAARPVLQVEGVSRAFGGVQALKAVDLELREGEILGLVGPNGSGKTTLFDIISGHQSPDGGRVLLEGVDITALPPHVRAQRKLVRRFQDARLFPGLSVREALLVALDQQLAVRNPLLAAVALPPALRAERRARARVERLLEMLELGPHGDKLIRELSTGLRRLVDLAFVLAAEPKVLLLDEPSSGVAQAEAEGLAPLLLRVRHETGCSILIIEHDIPLVTALADELVALVNGSVIARGPAREVLDDQRVIEAFLGTSEAALARSGSLVG